MRVNICGGLHHAMPERASGFCYLTDGVVAIRYIVNAGKCVAYIDIDAHHGDGVQPAFFDTDRVLTVSLHESGEYLFPGTGFTEEIGTGDGRGFSVNLPFPPGADDATFATAFGQLVPPLMEGFKPDVVVTQLGVDTFRSDLITHLQLTTNVFERMVRRMESFNLPWIALGGGGYNIGNVVRAWILAWAIMCNSEVDAVMLEQFRESAPGLDFPDAGMGDRPFALPPDEHEIMAVKMTESVTVLLERALPMIKRR